MNFILKLIILFSILPIVSCSQKENSTNRIDSDDTTVIDSIMYNSIYNPPYYEQFHNNWVQLDNGLMYIEKDAPRKSDVGDSKISILKIDSKLYHFEMLSASQFDSTKYCVVDWADKLNLNVVINASMYDLKQPLLSKGLLINNSEYANNKKVYEGYNLVIAFNPLDKNLPSFDIFDLKSTSLSTIKRQYASLAQGLRMIDGNGNAMSWNKNPQWCSQLIVAKDKHNSIYFFFTRSPYSHNEMIDFMMNFEEKLYSAIYMEGGPQTSLFVDTKKYRIEKLGSYVSRTYPTDENSEFWNLPNVIGLRKKQSNF